MNIFSLTNKIICAMIMARRWKMLANQNFVKISNSSTISFSNIVLKKSH